eukprot:957885-Amphidinium_carterae.1
MLSRRVALQTGPCQCSGEVQTCFAGLEQACAECSADAGPFCRHRWSLHGLGVAWPSQSGPVLKFGTSRSKSNECDEAVVPDSEDRKWLYSALFASLGDQSPEDGLLPVSHVQWNQLLKQAATLAGIADWRVSAHILRHVGPSHDFLNKLRSRPEILKRGRWKSDRCMGRYEKSAHMASKLDALPSPTLHFLKTSQAALPAVLGSGAALPVAVRRFLERGQ